MTTLTLHLTADQADAIRAALTAKTAQDAPMSTAETVNACAPERNGPPAPDENGTVTLTADDFDENEHELYGEQKKPRGKKASQAPAEGEGAQQ